MPISSIICGNQGPILYQGRILHGNIENISCMLGLGGMKSAFHCMLGISYLKVEVGG